MALVEEIAAIDEGQIERTLEGVGRVDEYRVREVLARGKELGGLEGSEVAVLMGISDPELLSELFGAARWAKEEIYGRRLVVFAPLYISNLCYNECLYCAFRARNQAVRRRVLSQEEIAGETRSLIEQGHKRLLVVAGEAYPEEGLSYVLKSIETIYNTTSGSGEIRRVCRRCSAGDFIVENRKIFGGKT